MKNYSKNQVGLLVKTTEKIIAELSDAIKWVDNFLKPELGGNTNKKLKSIRRELKHMHYAMLENPSAALYGLSQVGKSYLIKNLLSVDGLPFVVKDMSSGKIHNYLEEINPKGDKVEATSMVTRFSTSVQVPNEKFPLKVKLLTPKDIILILCDTYYRDITTHSNLPTADEIKGYIETTQGHILASQETQDYLTEDDIMDIKSYISENFPDKCREIIYSDFWTIMSNGISKVPATKWGIVLHLLWGKNQYISSIFDVLIEQLKNVGFAKIVYAEFASILRLHGTILHVDRLKELGEEPVYADVSKSEWIPTVSLFESNNNRIYNIKKSHLCALTEELVIPIDKELEKSKSFLNSSDLLDFPGARGRLNNLEDKIGMEHIGQMVLRGKVSYIFNRYSKLNLVTNLLFCNNDEQIATSEISLLLHNWIRDYVGNNPEERELFLKDASLPPLFAIYTFFNRDLTFNPINDNEKSLETKWTKRFITIFENEVVTRNFDWHKNWSKSEPYFKNNYMLRDFEYSNQIYEGYARTGKEQRLIDTPKMPDYFSRLQKSFLNHEFVKKHFYNPDEMWNESATPNKDGSELIIRNLNKVSFNQSRINNFMRRITKLKEEFYSEMKKHHHSTESSENIIKAGQQAGSIKLDMAVCFTDNPFAFGKFISAFLIDEADIYNFFKSKLSDIAMVKNANPTVYTKIRMDLGNTEGKKWEENMQTLVKVYNYSSVEDAESDMAQRGIDLKVLFYGDEEVDRIKNNATMLADLLRDYWFDKCLSRENAENIARLGISESSIAYLFDNIRVSFKNRHIADKIADNLRAFVNGYDSSDKAEEMIADMSAAIINKFITQMGWGFYSEEEITKFKETNIKHNLGLHFDSVGTQNILETDDLSDLFDLMSRYDDEISKKETNKALLKKYPSLYNLTRWEGFMHISFISNCDIPNYDLLANDELGKLLERISKVVIDIAESPSTPPNVE